MADTWKAANKCELTRVVLAKKSMSEFSQGDDERRNFGKCLAKDSGDLHSCFNSSYWECSYWDFGKIIYLYYFNNKNELLQFLNEELQKIIFKSFDSLKNSIIMISKGWNHAVFFFSQTTMKLKMKLDNRKIIRKCLRIILF